jgi:hypothetical protein
MIFDRPTRNVFRAGRLRVANVPSGSSLGRRPVQSSLALLVAGLQTGSFLRSFVFD